MKSSVSDEATQEDVYKAPDPRFISTLAVLEKGFPWEKFLEFFREKELVKCSAEDQVFLLRLIAVQEMLCMGDDALLRWTKYQFQLMSFLHVGYRANVPSKELLSDFRATIDSVGILGPFRKQCQKLVVMYGDTKTGKPVKKFIVESSSWGSQRVIALKGGEELVEGKSSKWISCPVCKSKNINKVLPPHWVSAQDGDWCRCRFCGNKFKVLGPRK